MGTVAIIWLVAAALLAMAILYWARFWALYVWALIFIALMAMAIAPADWAEDTAARLALKQTPDPDIIYEDESQYSYIAVKQTSKKPDTRAFMQDKLMHSQIIMADALNLQYSYEQIYAAVTHLLSRDKQTLSVLVIGGGGYVFPRYVEKVWPGSRVDVAEIDPRVTQAATRAFGLEPDTTINTFTMDARNYVSQLLQQQTEDRKIQYDFIYEDALDDYSIPYQLTTKEFNDKIFRILTDTGVYMIELIDIFDSGLFVGSFISTLEQTFPYVYVVTKRKSLSARNTFVIIAAKNHINLENLPAQESVKALDLWILSDAEVETLKKKAHRQSGVDLLSGKYQDLAQQLKLTGKFDQSITLYRELIELDPTTSITAYTEIANLQIQQGRLNEAAMAFQKAIDHNQKAQIKTNMARVHLDLALTLKNMGQSAKAKPHFQKAAEALKKKLVHDLDSPETLVRLGVALAELGRLSDATDYLQQAVDKNPSDFQSQLTLARILVKQKRYDEAVTVLKKAIEAAPGRHALNELQIYLQLVKNKAKY
jgi:tetratricopeptide (TPR) repeat protein